MNYTYAAMNKKTGVSLTSTMACTFRDAYEKAVSLGLDMNVWIVCRSRGLTQAVRLRRSRPMERSGMNLDQLVMHGEFI